MTKENGTPTPADAEIAAIIADMKDGTPAGTIFATLTERSLDMPQTLASIASNIGLTALDLIEDPSQEFTWNDFINLELTGKFQEGVAQVTTITHTQAGGGNTEPKVIAGIMPRVFDLARKSLIGSVVELSRGEDGKALNEITTKSSDPDFEAAKTYLFGENGEAHRIALRALLASNVNILDRQQVLAQDYQKALLGEPSTTFQQAQREQGNTLRSKRILTEHLRPLFLHPAQKVGQQHGLTTHQIGTFTANITRP